MKTYQISEALLQDVLRYLAQRPYREVVGAIAALSSLPPIPSETQEQARHSAEAP